MARSQFSRPLRVIVLTLLATPMVVALLAVGRVSAILAYFALPDSSLDGKRTLLEGTELAAPTTFALVDGPTATIRPTLEPLVWDEEDDGPTATPERTPRATATPAPNLEQVEAADERITPDPTPRSTPRSGTVAFLPQIEPTVVAASASTRPAPSPLEPTATPAPPPATTERGTPPACDRDTSPRRRSRLDGHASRDVASDGNSPARASFANTASPSNRYRYARTNAHAYPDHDAASPGPDAGAIPVDIDADRAGNVDPSPDQPACGDRNLTPDADATRDVDLRGERNSDPRPGADSDRGPHPDRRQPGAR